MSVGKSLRSNFKETSSNTIQVLVKYSPMWQAPFLVETEQHELEPKEIGANAMVCDDVTGGNEDGGETLRAPGSL